jgi:hypothetical protein
MPQTTEVLKDDLRELFQCPVCMETLNEPVTLMCQHTFCRACMQKEIKMCPICRARVWIPPKKTINGLVKETIIKVFGQTEYNTIYNDRAHSLLKEDLRDKVKEELREEMWRSVAEELPSGGSQSFIMNISDDDDDDDSNDTFGEDDDGEEFKLGFRFNELNHTTYYVIIAILVAIIFAMSFN